MIKFKAPLIVAGAALVLSFIIGLISGVRLSSIFIRSFMIAIIGGGFTFGAKIVLEKFTPEIFQNQKDSKNVDELGNNVNISIDDPIDVKTPLPVKEFTTEVIKNKAETNEGVDKVADNPKNDIETLNAVNEENYSGITEAGAENSKEVSSKGTIQNNDIEELEALPDLKEFAPDPDEKSSEEEQNDDDFSVRKVNSAVDSGNIAASNIDTNNMVQAIRTVLTRES